MDNIRLVEDICAQYCSFYKPGKDEELACGGFSVLERLFEKRKEVPAVTGKILLSLKTEDDLLRAVCRRCAFFQEDCDFAAWKRGNNANVACAAVNPCGAFLFLGICIDRGTVDIQSINRVT